MRILFFLLISVASFGQIPLWQLEYAPDSMKVIGAAADGEPIWVNKGAAIDTAFIDNDSLYYVIGTDTFNVGEIGGSITIYQTDTIPTDAKIGDLKYDVSSSFDIWSVWNGSTWITIYDVDNDPTNELTSYMFYYGFGMRPPGNKFGDILIDNKDDYIKYWDSGWYDLFPINQVTESTTVSDTPTLDLTLSGFDVSGKVDTSVIATAYDNSLKQNTLISGTNIKTINGNSLLGSGNVSISTVDSTIIVGGTGITAWESPANTWNIQNDDPDQTVTLSPTGIVNVSGAYPNFTIDATEVDGDPNNEKINSISWNDSQDSLQVIENGVIYRTKITGFLTETDTTLINQLISDSLSTYVFETDTSLINQLISDSLATINQDQIVSLTGAGITNVTGTYPNFTITSTEVDGSTTNEIQTLSQSFTGTTEATYTLSNSGGSVKDTTGFMRLETMFSTAGSRTYRYKSNLGAILGITEDPLLGGNSNIEVLRTGNQLTWGLRKDNASNGQIYKYNGTAWALSSDASGISSLNGLTPSTQTFATGTSGTDFNISSATSTHTFNFPTASASNRGLLSSADWTTFNDKLGTVTDGTTIDFTKSGANLTGEAIGLNYFFNAWNTKPTRFQYNIASTNGPTGGNVYGYTVPHTVSGYDWQMAADGSAGGLFYRGTYAGSTLGWEDVYSTYKPPKNLAYASDMSFNWSTVTTSANRYFKYMYANTNSPDGNTWYGIHVPHGANDTYAWQLAGQGGDLYYRGKEGGAYSAWSEIIKSTGNATLAGSGTRMVTTTSTGDLSTAAIPSALSGTLNAIPYFNTTTTLGSMPVTYSTALPAVVFPTGNAIHLVGNATIIDKANSYGGPGKFLSKPGDNSGGVLWDNPTFTIRNGSGGSSTGFAILPGNIFDIQAGTGITVTPDFTVSTNPKLSIAATGTNLGFTGASSPVTLTSSSGNDVTLTAGTNIEFSQASNNLTVNTNVSYGYMNTTATTQSMTAGSSYKIALTNEINNGVVTASNANDRFTVSATGIYEIHYDLGFAYASGSSSNILELSVQKNGNGSPITGTTSQSFSTASATPVNTSRTVIASLNATDYIELFAQMASGTISVTYNFGNFSIKRID